MENFQGKASERTWLTSIIKRKVIDHYRKINSEKGKDRDKSQFLRKWRPRRGMARRTCTTTMGRRS